MEAVVRQVIWVAAIAVVGLLGLSALPQSSFAGNNPDWPDLSPNCNDISGDGYVDLPNDILGVIQRFGAQWGDDDYALLYDVSGGGVIDLPNDILGVVQSYDTTCSLTDTQVVLGTLAVMKYEDPAVAFADGYTYGGQYVSQMGIHLVNVAYQTQYTTFYDPVTGEDQLRHPVGLVYSETSPGSMVPDVFLGPWYNVAVPAVCDFYGLPGPCQDVNVQPVGFGTTNTDEDNQDPAGPQAGWHTHAGLCVTGAGTVNAVDRELGPGSEQQCYDLYPGSIWFSTYGWMMHLYNFVPNPEGRFMLWNVNPELP